jgi:hypothetical protein
VGQVNVPWVATIQRSSGAISIATFTVTTTVRLHHSIGVIVIGVIVIGVIAIEVIARESYPRKLRPDRSFLPKTATFVEHSPLCASSELC